jgi:hypothetical protein
MIIRKMEHLWEKEKYRGALLRKTKILKRKM